ncbi:MAG: metalloregulator ArsR/SmtB family transcription factor [Chromatiales bacterium]|nr:metalloregulator ArsR/SmtB family transcription factor [Gammaproteobacteria bacterium]MBW6476106.1 metalloregulator ArsR/SmtB family transcription factor [Chromatiales bacterium]
MKLTPDHFFRLLGDPTRLRCLLLLQSEGELCVCELTEALETSQPKISRHLASLREGGLVSDRRQGQWIFYRIHEALPTWQVQVLGECLAAQKKSSQYQQDLKRLGKQRLSTDIVCCN